MDNNLYNVFIKLVYIVEKIFPSFQFLCCIQRNPSCLISKQLGRKGFQWSNFQLDMFIKKMQALRHFKICKKLTMVDKIRYIAVQFIKIVG